MSENTEQTPIKAIGPVWPVRQPDGSYILHTSKPDGYEAQHPDVLSLAYAVGTAIIRDQHSGATSQKPAPPPSDPR